MITATAQVLCDECGELVEVEMIEMSSTIPLFAVDNDIEELTDWQIDESTQHCPDCK